jgi:hypothetical protein
MRPDAAQMTYLELGRAVGLSTAEVHAAVRRAIAGGLVDANRRPRRAAFLEFLLHGLKYVFPAQWKGLTRGVPTSLGAPPLQRHFGDVEQPPVWPHAMGKTRGEGLLPLYRSVPDVALEDPEFYEWMALVDALRSGRGRERQLATSELQRRLS